MQDINREVIAVFDIGKTNKKYLLFDARMKLVSQEEVIFKEVLDDDGFPCDDMVEMRKWFRECLKRTIAVGRFTIKALNFSAYGATLMYLDDSGNEITPVYNYLKPMPDEVLDGFYEKYGGVEEFCRITASPALGMLNSGLQILWLKKCKPELFKKAKSVLHFPQYLSYLFTREISSEYTSIGCHTAMWNFDDNCYHQWMRDEGITLPPPVSNSFAFDTVIEGVQVKTGVGIHDSSASLVPYLMASEKPFILVSTGTWCIFMNPFNNEPLTAGQLRRDSLCYMSTRQKQVKSSRLFLGHIHDQNVERLSAYFSVPSDEYKKVQVDNQLLDIMSEEYSKRIFFCDGVPPGYVDISVNLSAFGSYAAAYHRLVYDMVDLCMESIQLIIPENDVTEVVYITGGFARNKIFVKLFANRLPGKKVYTSEMDNSSALGAMMVLYEKAFEEKLPVVDLGLKEV